MLKESDTYNLSIFKGCLAEQDENKRVRKMLKESDTHNLSIFKGYLAEQDENKRVRLCRRKVIHITRQSLRNF